MEDHHSIFNKYYILYSDVVYSTNDEKLIQDFENCYYIKRIGSLVKPSFKVNVKYDGEYRKETNEFAGYNELLNYINTIDEEQYICFIGFPKTLMHQLIKAFNSVIGGGIEFSKIDYLDKKDNQKSL